MLDIINYISTICLIATGAFILYTLKKEHENGNKITFKDPLLRKPLIVFFILLVITILTLALSAFVK